MEPGKLRKRYNVEFLHSEQKPKVREVKISLEMDPGEIKKIQEIVQTKRKFRNVEHFIQVAVRNLLKKELGKRTMEDVKIFSKINRRMKVMLFLFNEKQKVTDVSYVKIGDLAEFQLFETKESIVIVVDRDDYNYSIASRILSDSYYCDFDLPLHSDAVDIKDEKYLVFFYYKNSWKAISDEKAKDKLLKAALEFRMKTIDGFLTKSVSFFI